MNEERQDDQATKTEYPTHRVRLPGFINEQEIGLGDVIKRVTSTFGIAPCDDCARRAAMLNHGMVFSGGRTK